VLVHRVGTYRPFFLGDLSAAVIMGHAGQLERVVPERTAFPHCCRLFGNGGATPGGTHPASQADIHFALQCALCGRSMDRPFKGTVCHAPTSIPDLQFGSFISSTVLHRDHLSDDGGCIFHDPLVVTKTDITFASSSW